MPCTDPACSCQDDAAFVQASTGAYAAIATLARRHTEAMPAAAVATALASALRDFLIRAPAEVRMTVADSILDAVRADVRESLQ